MLETRVSKTLSHTSQDASPSSRQGNLTLPTAGRCSSQTPRRYGENIKLKETDAVTVAPLLNTKPWVMRTWAHTETCWGSVPNSVSLRRWAARTRLQEWGPWRGPWGRGGRTWALEPWHPGEGGRFSSVFRSRPTTPLATAPPGTGGK